MFAARAASRVAMASSARAGAAATVARAPAAAATVQKRTMAGGSLGEPRPKLVYTGFEKIVRDRLPEDYQLVLAVIGMYVGLYGVFKVTRKVSPSKASEEPVLAVTPSSTQSGGIPEGEEFYTWVDQPGNLEKYLATWEQD